MTESEWLAATEPMAMLEHLRGSASDRKLRLFACSCCRSMFATVRVNPWDRAAVVTAERYADGVAELAELAEAAASTTSDWTAAYACAEAASVEGGFGAAEHAAANAAWEVGSQVASRANVDDDDHPIAVAARLAERMVQADLLKDILGNPFRLVTIDPRWLTTDVTDLAAAIYEDRAFDRMPTLGDALMNAGCDNAEVIEHCRSDGVHVRGCWVVDLLLGKK